MAAPTPADVSGYLGENSWTTAQLTQALVAEKAAQASRCRVPADDAPWPADLTEALLRRVAANLANRALPLGVASEMSSAGPGGIRVGGLDREVRRLEGPHRNRTLG